MQIKITGHGLEVSNPLRDYALQKVGKLEEHISNIQKIEVVLDTKTIDNREKRQVVEIRAWVKGLKVIQAKEAGKDMYSAIDLTVEEARRQLEKHKDKMVHEKRREAKKIKILSRLKIPGLPFWGSSER